MSVTMVGGRRKIKKKHWLKCPRGVPKKTKFKPKYKLFKISYWEFFFWKWYFRHTKFLYLSRRSRINLLRRLALWALQNVLQFFILIEIFENSTSFSISIHLFITLKRWNFPQTIWTSTVRLELRFSLEVTLSQYQTIWQKTNKKQTN